MPSPTQKTGSLGESIARQYLQRKGYIFQEQNWHCRYGELDLIMWDGRELVFVEVKMRADHSYGYPEEMVSWGKAKRLSKTAWCYLNYRKIYDRFWRFDILSVTGKENDYEVMHFQDTIREDS